MIRYFAFLRAINVGGRFIKMEDLRNVISSLGYENVETYIQSGNIIFDTYIDDKRDLENQIEVSISDKFNLDAPTFVRDVDELKQLVNSDPFGHDDSNKAQTLYISLTKDIISNELTKILENDPSEVDEFRIFQNHIFWLYHRNKGKSKHTNNKIERTIKQQATRRNFRTIRKLLEKYSES
jgi:uncharacterized protein (DUF1697 family)